MDLSNSMRQKTLLEAQNDLTRLERSLSSLGAEKASLGAALSAAQGEVSRLGSLKKPGAARLSVARLEVRHLEFQMGNLETRKHETEMEQKETRQALSDLKTPFEALTQHAIKALPMVGEERVRMHLETTLPLGSVQPGGFAGNKHISKVIKGFPREDKRRIATNLSAREGILSQSPAEVRRAEEAAQRAGGKFGELREEQANKGPLEREPVVEAAYGEAQELMASHQGYIGTMAPLVEEEHRKRDEYGLTRKRESRDALNRTRSEQKEVGADRKRRGAVLNQMGRLAESEEEVGEETDEYLSGKSRYPKGFSRGRKMLRQLEGRGVLTEERARFSERGLEFHEGRANQFKVAAEERKQTELEEKKQESKSGAMDRSMVGLGQNFSRGGTENGPSARNLEGALERFVNRLEGLGKRGLGEASYDRLKLGSDALRLTLPGVQEGEARSGAAKLINKAKSGAEDALKALETSPLENSSSSAGRKLENFRAALEKLGASVDVDVLDAASEKLLELNSKLKSLKADEVERSVEGRVNEARTLRGQADVFRAFGHEDGARRFDARADRGSENGLKDIEDALRDLVPELRGDGQGPRAAKLQAKLEGAKGELTTGLDGDEVASPFGRYLGKQVKKIPVLGEALYPMVKGPLERAVAASPIGGFEQGVMGSLAGRAAPAAAAAAGGGGIAGFVGDAIKGVINFGTKLFTTPGGIAGLVTGAALGLAKMKTDSDFKEGQESRTEEIQYGRLGQRLGSNTRVLNDVREVSGKDGNSRLRNDFARLGYSTSEYAQYAQGAGGFGQTDAMRRDSNIIGLRIARGRGLELGEVGAVSSQINKSLDQKSQNAGGGAGMDGIMTRFSQVLSEGIKSGVGSPEMASSFAQMVGAARDRSGGSLSSMEMEGLLKQATAAQQSGDRGMMGAAGINRIERMNQSTAELSGGGLTFLDSTLRDRKTGKRLSAKELGYSGEEAENVDEMMASNPYVARTYIKRHMTEKTRALQVQGIIDRSGGDVSTLQSGFVGAGMEEDVAAVAAVNVSKQYKAQGGKNLDQIRDPALDGYIGRVNKDKLSANPLEDSQLGNKNYGVAQRQEINAQEVKLTGSRIVFESNINQGLIQMVNSGVLGINSARKAGQDAFETGVPGVKEANDLGDKQLAKGRGITAPDSSLTTAPNGALTNSINNRANANQAASQGRTYSSLPQSALTGTGMSASLSGNGFARGGYTGAGGDNDPAGVVHKEEFVSSGPATRRNRKLLEYLNAGGAAEQMGERGVRSGDTAVSNGLAGLGGSSASNPTTNPLGSFRLERLTEESIRALGELTRTLGRVGLMGAPGGMMAAGAMGSGGGGGLLPALRNTFSPGSVLSTPGLFSSPFGAVGAIGAGFSSAVGGLGRSSGGDQKVVAMAESGLTQNWAETTSGYCSRFVKQVFEKAEGKSLSSGANKLFGASAIESENLFKKRGLTLTPDEVKKSGGVRAGDVLFQGYGSEGFGHIGIADGKGNVIENSTRKSGFSKRGDGAKMVTPLANWGGVTSVGRLSLDTNGDYIGDGKGAGTAAMGRAALRTNTARGAGGNLEDAFVNSIGQQESRGSGGYGAVNSRTGALGKYQVMPQNLDGSWNGKRARKNFGWDFDALGRDVSPQEYLNSPDIQEKIAQNRMRSAYRGESAKGLSPENAAGNAARIWYSGSSVASDRRPGANEPSPNQYASEVVGRMRASQPGTTGGGGAGKGATNQTITHLIQMSGNLNVNGVKDPAVMAAARDRIAAQVRGGGGGRAGNAGVQSGRAGG